MTRTRLLLDANPDFLKAGAGRSRSDWLALGVLLAVGLTVTAALFLALGHFTRPATARAAASAQTEIRDPFVAEPPAMPDRVPEDLEACRVMSTAIEDINKRMSEGVTEEQARYFRSRRNRLYMLLRERCGA